MVAGEYKRLSVGSLKGALCALVEGKTPGICRDCGASFKRKQGKRYCDDCGVRRLLSKHGAKCTHPKPLFPTSGRERKLCFECLPPPDKTKPRKPHKPHKPQIPRHPKICQNPACGRGFLSKLEKAKYCSLKCGAKVACRAKQELKRDRSPRPCGYCKRVFQPAYGDGRSVYCSTRCCEKRMHQKKSGSTHRRRARKFGCEYEPVDRLVVFRRDGWRCQICGVKTPESKMGRRVDDAPELGHVISLADGGPHSYANTQCECHRCNRAKGARSFGQLRLGL